MLGRFASAGVIFVAGISAAFAAPVIPFPKAVQACANLAPSSQCSLQVVLDGTDDTAYSFLAAKGQGVQFALTYQQGRNNLAFTGASGNNQASLTIQGGENNGGYTYQNGHQQVSTTSESGNGGWSATSSVGDHTSTNVSLSSF
jgi:hypothetical protein